MHDERATDELRCVCVYSQVDLDLAAVEQIVEPSQVRAIADAIMKARSYMDGKRTLVVRPSCYCALRCLALP